MWIVIALWRRKKWPSLHREEGPSQVKCFHISTCDKTISQWKRYEMIPLTSAIDFHEQQWRKKEMLTFLRYCVAVKYREWIHRHAISIKGTVQFKHGMSTNTTCSLEFTQPFVWWLFRRYFRMDISQCKEKRKALFKCCIVLFVWERESEWKRGRDSIDRWFRCDPGSLLCCSSWAQWQQFQLSLMPNEFVFSVEHDNREKGKKSLTVYCLLADVKWERQS